MMNAKKINKMRSVHPPTPPPSLPRPSQQKPLGGILHGEGNNEITSVGYNYCYNTRSNAVAAIIVARVAQQGVRPHYSPRGEAEQRRQPALRSARPFDNMRNEPSSSDAALRRLRLPAASEGGRLAALARAGCCICALGAFSFVSNLTPESLYSIYRRRYQHAVQVSSITHPQLYRRVWSTQQNVCMSIRAALKHARDAFLSVTSAPKDKVCVCVALSSPEGLRRLRVVSV